MFKVALLLGISAVCYSEVIELPFKRVNNKITANVTVGYPRKQTMF